MTAHVDPTAAESLAIEAARLMSDLKCEEVVVLDVRGFSQVTDYVVIGSGTSARQILSVAEDVGELGDGNGFPVFNSARENVGNWSIVDFVQVTVHLFEPNTRAFYDLEHLFPDARRVDWRNGRTRPA